MAPVLKDAGIRDWGRTALGWDSRGRLSLRNPWAGEDVRHSKLNGDDSIWLDDYQVG